MTQSHYSLRWNNHQNHILAAFEALLQAETLVDVTLVCDDTTIKAHRVVLSACSPLFQRLLSVHFCEHPVIILRGYSGWVMQTIIDFMYKGEISVVQDQLQCLIKAADSLQVRGLATPDPFSVDKESTNIMNQTPTPSTSPNDYDRPFYSSHKYPMLGVTLRTPMERSSPFSPISNTFDPHVKLPHMSRLSFPETLIPESTFIAARRKQARPRRRSGELSGPQDLTTTGASKPTSPSQPEETAENLCMKKKEDRPQIKEEERKSCTPELSMRSPEMDLSTQSSGKEFRTSPISQGAQPNLSTNDYASLGSKQEIDSQSPLPFPPMPTVSALAMTPPHSKFFGLDSSLGLFQPGLDACRNPLFEMADPRNVVDPQIYSKKKSKSVAKPKTKRKRKPKEKMGRPKGQHSAPRGGPPRSWTNAELTQALQHVWNKKMTTSQASRVFGIPYNSLLMYVRGKYGKSLKLEQLRKDCIGGPNSSMDMLGNINTNNNNNNLSKSAEREQEPIQNNNRPSSTDQEPPPPQHPLFNPFSHSFYQDFGTGFPIPVSMIHLLPQAAEKNRSEHSVYGQTVPPDDELSKQNQVKELDEEPAVQELYRPGALHADDRRELVQQNGQD